MKNNNQPSGGYSYLMMLGHICCDLSQSCVPALLPFFVAHRGIEYAAAAGFMFANTSISSLIQPVLGMIADRKQMYWLMGLGILMSGLGIAAIGFLDSYWSIFLAIMVAGLGGAVFHPEGGRMANYVAGERKGRGMSIFSAGGNVGFVIGPAGAALALSVWGIKGITLLQIPTLIMAIVFLCLQKKFTFLANLAKSEEKEKAPVGGQKDDWGGFLRLCVSIFARSIVNAGLLTFIPLYWMGVLLQTQQQGSLMVTVMAVASTIAAFSGGPLADRFGFRRVIRIAIAAASPLILLMLMTKNVWVATALVVVIVAMVGMGHSPAIVLGQKYLPNRLGFSSGVTMGLYVSVGGVFSPLLGTIGDNYGLTTTMYVVAGVALIGFFATLLIKALPSPAGAAKVLEIIEGREI